MKIISLIKFIQESIEDEYAMNVFYYCTKKSFIDNDFSLSNISQFILDGRFLGEEVNIQVHSNLKSAKHAVSFLLSIRLLMLKPSYLDLCKDDNLIFVSRLTESYQWVQLMSIILDNWKDREVHNLYLMLERYYYGEDLTEEEKKQFQDTLDVPEFRNEKLFYQSIAKHSQAVENGVIGNNAFVDGTMDKYVISKDIVYVGDTAFAFCEKLTTLVFEDSVMLGIFPIIECNNLTQIIVPSDLLSYYKEQLPFYEKIIYTQEPILSNKALNDSLSGNTLNKSTNDIQTNHLDNKKSSLTDVVHESTFSIDGKKLETVFDSTTTSYKYFWFISIISLAKEKQNLVISYQEILVRMAALAWPIVFDYDIDLGKLDKIKSYLEEITRKTSLIKAASSKVVEKYLIQHYHSQGIKKILSPLLSNVPYRFLSPWIKYTSNEEVIRKSNSTDYDGLYALHKDSIVLDEDWWDYILSQYGEICNFTKQSFIAYAKHNNDSMRLLKLMTSGFAF